MESQGKPTTTDDASGTFRKADETFEIGDATVRISRPAPTVILYTFSGRMVPELVQCIRDAAAPLVAAGSQLDLFFDTEAMDGYHPRFRTQMTEWHEELKDATRSAGVLVRSRVVQMAIAIANLATGGKLVSFSDRKNFELAVRTAVREVKASA